MCLGAQTPFITIHQCPTVSCLLLLLQIIHVRYSLDAIVFFVNDVTALLGVFYKVVKERLSGDHVRLSIRFCVSL
jgi:hypothetical protein